MSEPKKGSARIEVPRRNAPPAPAEPLQQTPPLPSTSQLLMAHVGPPRRDPWVTPLAGLLLAFSTISLIIQLLIAFS